MTDQSDVRPTHIAIIPDGNRRWARAQGLTPMLGHQAGYQNGLKIARLAAAKGVKVVTFYAFSTENWQRAEEEVGFLMGLFAKGLAQEVEGLHRDGFRLRFFGARDRISQSLQKQMAAAEERTAGNSHATLNFCVNYGGRSDLVYAVRRIVASGAKADDVDGATIAANLSTAGTPPPDLLIRTSGEQRLSNLLLWEGAYAELMFFDCFWPDFGEAELDTALAEYARRQRRFGK